MNQKSESRNVLDKQTRLIHGTVSAVIVNYNAGHLLIETVAAVLASAAIQELLVVDNNSKDDSIANLREAFRRDSRLTVIENGTNTGFASAANLALRRARGDFLLLLNPDCVIDDGTIERVLDALREHPDAGMAGCLLRNPDGSEQAGCRRTVPTPWRVLMRMLSLDRLFPRHARFQSFVLTRDPLPQWPVFIEAISGAFMIVRREVMDEVGLLDEKYFMHCEDLDWCLRFRRAGWKILFVPDVEAVHYRGTCSKDRPVFVLWHKHKGMVRFYRKFFHQQYPWPLMLLITIAVWARFTLLAAMTLFSRPEPVSPGKERHPLVSINTGMTTKAMRPEGISTNVSSSDNDLMPGISSTDTRHHPTWLP